MRIDDKIRDEKLHCNINKEAAQQHYYLKKLINIDIIQVKTYCLLIKDK